MNLKSKLLGTNPNESTPLSRAIFFIIIGIAFYLLDRFSLFIIDDYDYAFKFGTYERIRSLKDIFVSQCDHYMLRNGRFLVHCVVQLFCGILGIEWFRIFNTVMFVLFCGMTTRLVSGTYRTSIMWYAVTAFAIWLFIPRFGMTLLGNIAWCVNYLWVGVATLTFVILWQKISQKEKECTALTNIGLGVVGAIIGSFQESFSIPVAGALFIYYCFNFKKFRGSIVWLVCGYWLGALALIVAPGNFIRLQKEASSENLIIISIRRTISILSTYWLLGIVVALHIILWWRSRSHINSFITQNVIYYMMLLIGLTFTVFVAYTGMHQLFFIGWLLICIMLKLLHSKMNLYINTQLRGGVIGLVTICIVPMYVSVYSYRSNEYELHHKQIREIMKSNDGNIILGDAYKYEFNKSKYGRRYTAGFGSGSRKDLVSMYYTGDTDHFKNYIPCSLNELESLTANRLPMSSNIWHLKDFYCYIIKIPKTTPIEKVKIEATYPIKGVSKIKRKLTNEPLTIAYLLTEEQIRDVVSYGDYQYAILWQPYNGEILDLKIIE